MSDKEIKKTDYSVDLADKPSLIENEAKQIKVELKETSNPQISIKRPIGKKRLFFEDENGKKWGFNSKVPPKFRFNGLVKTKEKWLEDKDAMEMLVYGKSMYVKQIKK